MAGRTRLVALEAREREEAMAKLTLWGGPDDAHRRCALFAAAPHPNPFPIVRRVQRGEERARLLGQALKSAAGHERRFRDVGDESGLPPTPERLRHRSEPTLRTRIGYSRPGYRVVLTRHHSQKSRALNRRIFLNPRNIPPFASPGSETVRPQRPGWPVAILDYVES